MTDVKVYRNGARTGGVQSFKPSTPVTHQAYPQVRGKRASVLAAAARAALYAAVGTALVLVSVAAMIWPAYGPQGLWTVAWLGVVFVTVAGCAVAWEWLGKRRRGGP